MPVIKFLTSDDIIIETDDQIAQCSDIIRPLLDMCSTEEGDLPKLKVSAAILRKVIEWAEHHKYDPSGDAQCTTDPWDTQFISVDQPTLFELIQAANYLNIKGLLTLTCKAVANMITGKTPEEIRKLFEIKTNSARAGEYYD
ncbi:S-phase kinase-associated protein 1-like isoform X1 [Drosophila montana]|uniref:S-phase kinase-associated protein 1-like isoform X1 n=1 Tax=Drosophila montana TaxID=40370 RepID=UPI00313EB6DA